MIFGRKKKKEQQIEEIKEEEDDNIQDALMEEIKKIDIRIQELAESKEKGEISEEDYQIAKENLASLKRDLEIIAK